MSSTNWVVPEANASIQPFVVGTIAMLLVMDPSKAFKVETSGLVWPSGHKVRYPRPPRGDHGCVQHEGLGGIRNAAKAIHDVHLQLSGECTRGLTRIEHSTRGERVQRQPA